MTRANPYNAVKGIFPGRKDYGDWKPDRWMDFLRFVEWHIVQRTREGRTKIEDRFSITKKQHADLEKWANEDNPWAEFITRIGEFPSEGKSLQRYLVRMRTLVRQVLTYLKHHPSLITDEMKALIEKYPARMGWCLSQYFIKDTPQGEVLQRDTLVDGEHGVTKVVMPSVQKMIAESLVTTVDMLNVLVKSIKNKDLKNSLTVKEKINAIPKLIDAIVKMGSRKTGPNHFTQINIHGGAREMEESMLDYVKQKNKDND